MTIRIPRMTTRRRGFATGGFVQGGGPIVGAERECLPVPVPKHQAMFAGIGRGCVICDKPITLVIDDPNSDGRWEHA